MVVGTVVTLWLAEGALEVVGLWELAECQLEVVVLEHLAVLSLGVQLYLLRRPPLVGWRSCCLPQNGSLRVHCTPAHIAIEGKGNVLTHV